MHPTGLINRLGGFNRVIPVTGHHRIPSSTKFAGFAPRQRLAGFRVRNANINMRVRPTNRFRAVHQGILGQRLSRHGRRFGHAVTDGHFPKMHPLNALLHHRNRTGRAGHHPGAQGG